MESRRGSPAEGLTPTPAQLTARCAGACYPADPALALDYFGAALQKIRPAKTRNGEVRRPIVPHIDFRVNLGLYAETYAQWRDANWFPSRIIILGVGHRSRDEFACLPAGFKTPFGEVDPDHAFHNTLASRCPFPLVRDAQAFQGEHSIEFVVVWLQVLRDLFFPDRTFTILPILYSGLQDFVEKGVPPSESDPAAVFAKALAGLPGADDPDTAWVASIDGCHVGPRFQHPFEADEKVRRLVASWEKHLWSLASTETLPDFFQHLSSNSNGFYFDGVGVLHTLLAGRNLKAEIQPTVHWHDPSDQSLVSFSRGHLKSVGSG